MAFTLKKNLQKTEGKHKTQYRKLKRWATLTSQQQQQQKQNKTKKLGLNVRKNKIHLQPAVKPAIIYNPLWNRQLFTTRCETSNKRSAMAYK
jgi:hypothetical protein